MRRASLWLPPIVYMFLIFHLSSASSPMPEVTSIVWDKLLHATEYAGLAFLVCRALTGERIEWSTAALGAILLTSAYGVTDEWHQAFVPLRETDVYDWVADSTGALFGAALYVAVTLGKSELRS
jgi:VanZ family protein